MTDSGIKKSQWSSGQPSLEIEAYQHTRKGFESILGKLCRAFDVKTPNYSSDGVPSIPSLMTYEASVSLGGGTATVRMEEFGCSIAFSSEKLRDEAYLKLVAVL